MGSTRPLVGVALFLLAAIAALLVGCGDGGGDTDRSSSGDDSAQTSSRARKAVKPTAVTIQDYLYKPASLTVPVGTTVTFSNRDSTPHTATSKQSGVFESGSIDTGKSAQVTLDRAGTFAYYCLFHPFMKGTIIVSAP